MNILTLLNQMTQTVTDVYQGNDSLPSQMEESLQRGMETILRMANGQSVSGEVLMVNGNDLILSLGDNQLLQAKLQGNTLPKTGQMMTFQIMNTTGNKVILTPLYENVNQKSNISTALKAAGIPMTDQTIQMVKDMMQEGLPINKQSLYQMNRAMNLNQGVSSATLAQMRHLGIPLEPEMIQQYRNYQNYEHQITNSIVDLTDSFMETYELLDATQGTEDALQFVKDVLNEFNRETPVIQEPSSPPPIPSENIKPETVHDVPKEMPLRSLKQVIAFIDQILSNPEVSSVQKEKLSEILKGKDFKELFQNEVNKQLLLEPAEVAVKDKVEQLYERLNEQVRHFNDLLSGTARQDTPLAKAVTNLNQNLDFINAVNQNFTYVQIPLKMFHQNTSGEIFVYTNKKNLAQKEGHVSALLHLDMEYLGSVDVHVALDQGQKVSTKFYLQDEAALDLVEEHMDMLTERLQKRGYTMNVEVISKDTKTNVIREILEEQKNISVLSGTSFDARA